MTSYSGALIPRWWPRSSNWAGSPGFEVWWAAASASGFCANPVHLAARLAGIAAAAGITSPIGLVLADAGYWSEDNATDPGPDRLIATTKDWRQRKAARALGQTTGPAPQGASALEAMEHRLRTPEGTVAYATRSYTVEPVFGNAKENHGFRRFMRRGLAAAESEAALIFTTHNLMKIFHHTPSAVFAVS